MKSLELIDQLAFDLQKAAPPPKASIILLRLLTLGCLTGIVSVGLKGLRFNIEEVTSKLHFKSESLLLFSMALMALTLTAQSSVPSRLKSVSKISSVIGLMGLFLLISVFSHERLFSENLQGFMNGSDCTLMLFAWASPAAAWGFYSLKHRAYTRPGLSLASLALGTCSLAALFQQLICPQDEALHLLAWHYVPLLLASGSGLLLGHRLLRWEIKATRRLH